MNKPLNMLYRAKVRWAYYCRHLRYRRFYQACQSANVSIICNDCTGGIIYKSVNCRFNSPTINLKISNDDFLNFCRLLPDYLNGDLEEVSDSKCPYPCGKLIGKTTPPILIEFIHYPDFITAKEKWVERSKRLNLDNLFILFNAQFGIAPDQLNEFLALEYKKAILVRREPPSDADHPDIYPCVPLSCKKHIITFRGLFGKRIVDDFDFISIIFGVRQ